MLEFEIGSPVAPGAMVDRKAETSDLVTKILSKKTNYNIALVGHRRIGKTSILYKAREELARHDNVAVAYFDVRENLTEPRQFLEALESAIFGAYLANRRSALGSAAAGRERAARLVAKAAAALATKRIRSVELGVNSEGAIVPRLVIGDGRPDYGKLFMSVLKSAGALAEKEKVKFVLMIDEFQDLEALSRYAGLGDIFALFRSAVQDSGPNVSFVVSCSKVRLSEAILSGGRSPLFAHYHIQQVGELDRASSATLFKRYVAARNLTDRRGRAVPRTAIAEASAAAFELVGGHPYYLLVLADAWDGRGGIAGTYKRLLTSPVGLLHTYCEYVLAEDMGLAVRGPLSRAILEAVAAATATATATAAGDGDGDRDGAATATATYSAIARAMSYRIERLPRYVRPLVEADFLVDGKGFAVRDRVLRDYLRAGAARKARSRSA